MTPSPKPHLVTSALLLLAVLSTIARATPPNPLESAYWRFEEGSNLAQVNATVADPVHDSINQNHLDAFTPASAPTYTSAVPPTMLKSGFANTLALDFIRTPGANDDLFTLFSDGEQGKGLAKKINNGIISPGGGFTVEAAFNTTTTTDFQAIIAKEGRPALGKLGGDFTENLPTFVVKTRGDNQLLQVEMWDAARNLVQVSSLAPVIPGQWYYTAVVNNGTTLSLYLNSNDGQGYQLQGSTAVNGALYQGDDPLNPSWDNSWTIGRGQFGGGPADFFDGSIDEVRLTNSALSPSQFLFAPASAAINGDYNNNGIVDAADYTVWRDNLGRSVTLPNDTTPGTVTQADYTVWKSNFGAVAGAGSAATVPEPAAALLCLTAVAFLLATPRAGWRGDECKLGTE